MFKYKNKIIQGECLDILKTLPDESVDMVMTSPPYWALRDYGVEGQLGLESTFQEYIGKLCDIFDEVKRVLKKEGTCWVNLGDSYSQSGKGGDSGNMYAKKHTQFGKICDIRMHGKPTRVKDLPPKCLVQIPSRFAIEMTNRGWILRNEIIWHKPNCMPCSVKDRFTVDFEKIFLFSKNKEYYFETQFEENQSKGDRRLGLGKIEYNGKYKDRKQNAFSQINPQGRNKRCVWTVTTTGFPEAHFAVYPEQLCVDPIRAGCPEFVCKKCGKARQKICQYTETPVNTGKGKERWLKDRDEGKLGTMGGTTSIRPNQSVYPTPKKQIGWEECDCGAGFEAGIVLDPFFGAGTTGVVAKKLLRNYVGIELSPEYIKIAEDRLAQKQLF